MPTTVILTPDQEEIRSVARRFLEANYSSERLRELMASEAGYEVAGWEKIAELGWAGIALPEDRGGAGYGMAELCLLLEEMGHVLLPDPFLSSAVLAADAVAAAGSDAADALLAEIVEGSKRAALVLGGELMADAANPAGEITAAKSGDGYALNGSAGLTLDGHTAQVLVVAAAVGEGEVGLFAVDGQASGLTRTAVPMVDETRKLAELTFKDTPAARLDEGLSSAALATVLNRGAIALAAEMVGGAQRCLDITVAYMRERHQFGVPIGSFQALKHRVADLHVQLEGARELVYLAADVVDEGDTENVPLVAAAAKVAAAEAYVHVSAEAIQLHGGIGFTAEADVHLYYKRALCSAEMLGGAVAVRERIARHLDV
jgi:alkylation response protein AidB-like acyl-CoA dehydrogenase